MKQPGKTNSSEDSTTDWQKRLLPWFIILPTALIAIFIVLATRQVTNINEKMQVTQDTAFVNHLLMNLEKDSTPNFEQLKWITLVKMEQESFYKRYNQAQLLLMSRIFTKYLGFFTGMILAIVGAVFIIGKIKEDTTNLTGSFSENTKFTLVSSSPGIIFGVLGTLLMLSTIWQHKEIEVRDQSLYLKPPVQVVISKSDSTKTMKHELGNITDKEMDDMFGDEK